MIKDKNQNNFRFIYQKVDLQLAKRFQSRWKLKIQRRAKLIELKLDSYKTRIIPQNGNHFLFTEAV